ncbi:transcriptional regulator [Oleiphilus sp. HI0009]|nr:transcriptional regulator [Oleiphilus sp. HI0009]
MLKVKLNAKTEKIIDLALEMLKNQGSFGVTMRQVASHADMSLSNVQYYFKNRDELLKAMADRYFEQCLDELRSINTLKDRNSLEEKLSPLISAFLSQGVHLSDMCRIFREYWAISSRNDAIKKYILEYYKEMASILMAKLLPVAHSEKSAAETVSLIIPYIEGYSITGMAMPEGIERMTELMVVFCVGVIDGES